MKTKYILLLILSGIITLSFSFVSVRHSQSKENKVVTAKESQNEPVGGFVSADQL
jgi:hypothetical protein